MPNQYHALYEKEGEWWIGYCPEIPGANGQGKTLDECRESLTEAIKLTLEDRLEDTLKDAPPEVIKEFITV